MNATMLLENVKHYPVMLDQVLSIISPQHGGTFIDCTFGGGGYSQAILKFPNTNVVALDRDKITKKYANELKKKFSTYEKGPAKNTLAHPLSLFHYQSTSTHVPDTWSVPTPFAYV